jgi:antitoxin component YwqK of YwqJK toxin-antitoxin module
MSQTERTYFINGQVNIEYQMLDGEKHGKFIRYFENGQMAIEANFFHGKIQGPWREWYESGQLAEEGEYRDVEYYVNNFWNEDGDQLLINGTGKTIIKIGTTRKENCWYNL